MSRIHEALKRAEEERAAGQRSVAGDLAPIPISELPAVGDGVPRATAVVELPAGLEAMLTRTVVAQWQPDPATMLFANGNDRVPGTEEYRTLRSRLYHLREKMPLKKILVTSALPKEGKSFTSANLAQVMARQHGRRVLLIDADLRAPRLHLMLGTEPGPGLSDYLQDKNDEFSIMQRGPMENLFFIPSGRGIEDPAELVGNGRMKLFLQRVESLFDWIIIDSPPAVPVSDASVLAKACDGVVMVVRSNSTPADVARRARQEFPDHVLLGVVLNGRRQDEAPYQRYYYGTYEKKGNQGKGADDRVTKTLSSQTLEDQAQRKNVEKVGPGGK
jgi:protein-tyrosine kinase